MVRGDQGGQGSNGTPAIKIEYKLISEDKVADIPTLKISGVAQETEGTTESGPQVHDVDRQDRRGPNSDGIRVGECAVPWRFIAGLGDYQDHKGRTVDRLRSSSCHWSADSPSFRSPSPWPWPRARNQPIP